jgi:putative N6-adenine-specific DNA methylase
MSRVLEMFAACAPGLEGMLRAELVQLGVAHPVPTAGGIAFAGGLRDLYRTNLESGLATHVLLRVARFPSRHVAHLRKRAAAVPWGEVLAVGQPFVVRATSRQSKLYHTGAVAERVALAIAETSGAVPAPAADDTAVEVVVRVLADMVTISVDTSGAPLHRRGYRLATGKAPLREDLARALLLTAPWDPATPLVDPMAGAGTIPIEAALLARRLAPGRLRGFAFQRLSLHDPALLAEVIAAAEARALPRAPAPIFGSDRDAGAVAAAVANAARAGVRADVELTCAPLRGAPVLCGTPPAAARGAVVTNPPFGRRVGDAQRLRNLYQALGHAVRRLPPEWRIALCAADRRLALRTGLPLRSAFLTTHGGIRVRALCAAAGDASAVPPLESVAERDA